VRAIVTDRKGREEKLTYAAGQINVNTNKVFASTLTPNVNVLVQFWDVSSEMYNVGAKRSRPIIVVGTREVMPPSLFVSLLLLLGIEEGQGEFDFDSGWGWAGFEKWEFNDVVPGCGGRGDDSLDPLGRYDRIGHQQPKPKNKHS
jgi:hypothetical protein